MSRALIRSLSVSLALLGAIPLAGANDLGLLGCWRLQNVDQYHPGGKIIRMNSDCVSEISAKQIRSECERANGRPQNLSTYEITAPGRYVATPSDGGTAANEPPQQRAVEYAVDGEWLTVTFFPQKPPNAPIPPPDKVVTLSARVNALPGKDLCHPRGPSAIRVGNGPVSSLTLTVPKAYVPVLKDLFGSSADPALVKAINSNFLIGLFMPAPADGKPMPERGFVLVVEDSKIGSRPIKPGGFREFKASRKQEIGQDKVSCEDEKRLCFGTAFSEGGAGSQPSQISKFMTTEFVNVKGRIAIVYGVVFGGTPEASKAAKRSADVFAEQIVRDNP
jgi:hypothetical protein